MKIKKKTLHNYIRHNVYRWRCCIRLCRSSTSIRSGSWFSHSHLSIEQILELTFCWSEELPLKTAVKWSRVTEKTVIDWFNFCRDTCAEYLHNHSTPIDGLGKIVEIDESKFGKRKYNRRRHVDGRWVIGGIERGSDNMFLQIVDSRDARILIPIIQANVQQGSIIHTDDWKAYRRLPRYGYTHHIVNHSENFVDPTTGAHTHTIESTWGHVKSKYKKMHGTSRDLFPTYLIEHIWRRRHGGDTPFATIINCIVATYHV